ncbi:YwiC-like family protein [Natribacillus halophilus]|uniref:Uncharacterized protein n=1 Tax=Natribacillus halophilus TaxID=549003 RepID=A0A1G8SVV6_9BACI|nr:YwiC-like family protein [Natribacillus halophilus]SDJ32700.1 hypothetical protein SAMN04488123_1368 [Natribacillus halophilus]
MQNQQQEVSERERTERKGALGLISVPVLMSIFAIATPEFDWFYAWFLSSIVGLLIIYGLINVITKRHHDRKQRFIYNIVVLNISALFMLIMTWRVYDEALWLGLLLLIVYFLVLALAIIKRNYFLGVITQPRKNSVGGKIYAIVLLAAAVIGPSSYGYAVAISSQHGTGVAMTVLASMLVPFAYLIVLMITPSYEGVKQASES